MSSTSYSLTEDFNAPLPFFVSTPQTASSSLLSSSPPNDNLTLQKGHVPQSLSTPIPNAKRKDTHSTHETPDYGTAPGIDVAPTTVIPQRKKTIAAPVSPVYTPDEAKLAKLTKPHTKQRTDVIPAASSSKPTEKKTSTKVTSVTQTEHNKATLPTTNKQTKDVTHEEETDVESDAAEGDDNADQTENQEQELDDEAEEEEVAPKPKRARKTKATDDDNVVKKQPCKPTTETATTTTTRKPRAKKSTDESVENKKEVAKVKGVSAHKANAEISQSKTKSKSSPSTSQSPVVPEKTSSQNILPTKKAEDKQTANVKKDSTKVDITCKKPTSLKTAKVQPQPTQTVDTDHENADTEEEEEDDDEGDSDYQEEEKSDDDNDVKEGQEEEEDAEENEIKRRKAGKPQTSANKGKRRAAPTLSGGPALDTQLRDLQQDPQKNASRPVKSMLAQLQKAQAREKEIQAMLLIARRIHAIGKNSLQELTLSHAPAAAVPSSSSSSSSSSSTTPPRRRTSSKDTEASASSKKKAPRSHPAPTPTKRQKVTHAQEEEKPSESDDEEDDSTPLQRKSKTKVVEPESKKTRKPSITTITTKSKNPSKPTTSKGAASGISINTKKVRVSKAPQPQVDDGSETDLEPDE